MASIKPSAAGGNGPIRLGQRGGPGSADPGRVTYHLSTIRDLIMDAYDVKRSQIAGGPGWLDSEQFDIVAKVPAGATKEQIRAMLQNLLAERFHLTLHRETKELPTYALVIGAKGPKLKGSASPDAVPLPDAQTPQNGRVGIRGMKIGADGCPEAAPVGRSGSFTVVTPNGECMIAKGQTMEGLAQELANRLDRPVIDQTGLNGKYDVRLRYDPASVAGVRRGMSKDPQDDVAAGPAVDRNARDGAAPGIVTALQQQLGLKLESRTRPVSLLVIDHVDKTPAGN